MTPVADASYASAFTPRRTTQYFLWGHLAIASSSRRMAQIRTPVREAASVQGRPTTLAGGASKHSNCSRGRSGPPRQIPAICDRRLHNGRPHNALVAVSDRDRGDPAPDATAGECQLTNAVAAGQVACLEDGRLDLTRWDRIYRQRTGGTP